MADSKKYYWLKLDEDFFKRHDVKVIEAMPNGESYIIFYLKLLCESISHCGRLRFNDTIPYNEHMLSAVTGTNVDVVKTAIQLFCELHMMEILDDKTIYMNEVNKMLGSETGAAKRKREYREKSKEIGTNLGQCPIESKPKKRSKFVKPTVEEIASYCNERRNNIDPNNFYDYYESIGWKVGNKPMKDWKACVRTWEKRTKTTDEVRLPDWFDKQDEPPSEDLMKQALQAQKELDES